MLFAALISRSCTTPQLRQHHALTPSALSPLGPVRTPHAEQVTLEPDSLTSLYSTPSLMALYASIVRSWDHPASCVDLASRVLAILLLETLPTAITLARSTIVVVVLCAQSLRLLAIC